MKNIEEGSHGRYLGIDIDPNSGVLFKGEFAEVGDIKIGDSIEILKGMSEPVDLFISDSDHENQYENNEYEDKTQSYLIAPQDIKVGTKIHSGRKKDIEIGNCMPLIDIPPATVVHNVEMRPGNGAVLARSAGTSVQIMSHDQDYTTLKLASGEVRRVQSLCKATIGAVSNPDQKNIKKKNRIASTRAIRQ